MLRDDNKLFFLASSDNWMKLPHLLSFIRMADFVASQLGSASDASGLSVNQAMVCYELAAWKEQCPSGNVGLSLKEMTTRLAASRARLHAQLKKLITMGIVRATDRTHSKLHRGPGYVLTTKGQRRYDVFAKHAESARAEVAWVFFHHGRKRHEAWAQMSELLTKHLTRNGGAT